MRVKTGKAVSKILEIWIFFLLLILKGAFPKAAFAQSTNRCALSPECLAVIKESAGSAIAAPTGAGFGVSTLSTTTATGATSSSVQAVANFAVVNRLGAVAIWHYWNQTQNEQAQNRAKERYCFVYASEPVCGIREVTFYSPNNYRWLGYRIPQHIISYTIGDCYGNWQDPTAMVKAFLYTRSDGTPPAHSCDGPEINPLTLNDQRTGDVPWQDWPQAKRDAAVALLNNSDWQGFITSMPGGGILNPGDTIHAPGEHVIPGQETDDPSTPADERLLRREPGFFTAPGLPDFDKDGFPNQNDPDDDNDGTSDTNDPQPYNPNVPFATNNPPPPGPSAEPSPQDLQEVHDIASSHPNTYCVECANEIEAYLRAQGIHGRRIKLDTPRQTRFDDYIMDNSLPPTADAISENGHHEGIAIRINGEEKVFDNHHPDGVTTQQWMNNLTFDSKERSGASFIETGYRF